MGSRFIPAWAGNTLDRYIASPTNDGSSPRGRGTPCIVDARHLERRFIPAWAGNTLVTPPCRTKTSVHPRVGGEHRPSGGNTCLSCGSSPRGRGTHPLLVHVHLLERFIPAWAGNTPVLLPLSCTPTVHPRVGGEHTPWSSGVSRPVGSSPRGRGTRFGGGARAGSSRFIPAWAGNTCGSRRKSSPSTVHPRVGGEHILARGRLGPFRGSSPRGRGEGNCIPGEYRELQ